jgi:hypothetical protein
MSLQRAKVTVIIDKFTWLPESSLKFITCRCSVPKWWLSSVSSRDYRKVPCNMQQILSVSALVPRHGVLVLLNLLTITMTSTACRHQNASRNFPAVTWTYWR